MEELPSGTMIKSSLYNQFFFFLEYRFEKRTNQCGTRRSCCFRRRRALLLFAVSAVGGLVGRAQKKEGGGGADAELSYSLCWGEISDVCCTEKINGRRATEKGRTGGGHIILSRVP